MDIPKINIKIPTHFPKMKPARIPSGEPKPPARTQMIVNKKNAIVNK